MKLWYLTVKCCYRCFFTVKFYSKIYGKTKYGNHRIYTSFFTVNFMDFLIFKKLLLILIINFCIINY